MKSKDPVYASDVAQKLRDFSKTLCWERGLKLDGPSQQKLHELLTVAACVCDDHPALSVLHKIVASFPDVEPNETEKHNSMRVMEWAVINAIPIRFALQHISNPRKYGLKPEKS